MKNKPNLVLLGVRHGATPYSEQGLDLTELGIKQIKTFTEKHIPGWMARNDITDNTLMLVSSPAARAMGTATLLKIHGKLTVPTTINRDIGPMEWRDKTRCREALKGLSGRGYIDYETEPVFADPLLFETQEEMRERWYSFLAKLIEEARNGSALPHQILVSHYEVFCHVTRDLFGVIATESTALKNAEHFELAIFIEDDGTALVEGTFRNIKTSCIFNLSERRLQD